MLPKLACSFSFTCYIFRKASHVPRSFKCPGSIFIKNTTEEFKNCDKKLLVKDAANKVGFLSFIGECELKSKLLFWSSLKEPPLYYGHNWNPCLFFILMLLQCYKKTWNKASDNKKLPLKALVNLLLAFIY